MEHSLCARQYAKYLACIISVNPHQHPVNRYLNTYLKLARLRVREVVFCPRSHGKIQRQIFGATSPEPAQEWGWGCSSETGGGDPIAGMWERVSGQNP